MKITESELRLVIRQIIKEDRKLNEKIDISNKLKKAGTIAAFLMMFAGGASQVSAQDLNKPQIAEEVTQQIMEGLTKEYKEFFTEDVLSQIKDASSPEAIKNIVRNFQIFLIDKDDTGMREIVKARKKLETVLNKSATKNWSDGDFESYKNRNNN